ncbi:arginine N-succinyltransferase [Shewanella metallivivens]|uniref:Arginine N-succinyltransferase n=1 Tax=Shewanella metallivivens TaxID=2872342 RepID=A0ABT5TNH1_9GAMM|nr:arginine N-succinyltransferase [Shewanella metallivivens]MDD8060132.1 arginine N-succinyltransferase [Shewanella metallivivens]
MRASHINLTASYKQQTGASAVKLLLIILATMLVTAGLTFFVIRTYIFPSAMTPVTLNTKEEQQLDHKLTQLGWQVDSSARAPSNSTDANNALKHRNSINDNPINDNGELTPQAYREYDAERQVTFSEKEVNAMIGRNPDFAKRVAIDFSNNLASATMLIPIPHDFPVMAGEILRVNTGLDIRLDANRRPVVALVGVSLMGVPIPNAWLGNMKNVNLVSEFGDRGFWNTFADGVDDIQIRDGELYIKLRQ